MTAPVYLVRVPVLVPALVRFGQRRRMPPTRPDAGYMVHSLLRETFGDLAPQPFSVGEPHGNVVEILGYAPQTATSMKEHADRFAKPDVFEAVAWDGIASKAMPTDWPGGTRLGFTVRVCPVIRLGRGSDIALSEGQEIDAWLAEAKRAAGEPPVREEVYRTWLKERIEPAGAAVLETAGMVRFSLDRLWRRNQDRKVRETQRPNATFEGVLQVADGGAFGALLSRGVGRHRTFGFGMMLLKAPPC